MVKNKTIQKNKRFKIFLTGKNYKIKIPTDFSNRFDILKLSLSYFKKLNVILLKKNNGFFLIFYKFIGKYYYYRSHICLNDEHKLFVFCSKLSKY